MEQSNEKQSYAFTPETCDFQYQALPNILRDNAKIFPDREAVVFLSTTGERTSIKYQELYDQAKFFAKGLLETGIKRNDVVAISNKNCVEWVISSLGVQMAGGMPLHFFFKRLDGSDLLETLHGIQKCTTLIIDPGDQDKNVDICRKFACNFQPEVSSSISSKVLVDLYQVLLLQPSHNGITCPSVANIIEKGRIALITLPLISPDDIAAIFLTSGSTGIPKAVPQTHLSLVRSLYGFGKHMELDPGARYYNDRPFSWTGGYPGVNIVHKTTRITASDVMALKTIDDINRFTAKALEAENCTAALIITPCLHDMMHTKLPPCKQWPLKVIATGGLPVESSCTKAAGVIADKVVVMYGTTEFGLGSAMQVSNPNDFEDYAIGYPTPGVELKIVDDDGNIVPKGTSGEIYFRSRDRFQGYLNNKEKSALCLDKAGWYKTDDIGVMRENGIFIVNGRKSDMMIIGGLLVTPLCVENIIKKHPNVIDAYVYPVHDDKMFQRIYAAVVVQPEGTLSDEAIRNYIVQQQSGNLDSFLEKRYIPEHFFFYKELPHTHNGKLDRKTTALMIELSTKAEGSTSN
ncbi:3-[(3aS,4S,7aS)-7a-methyl-1,5-dioxo-octahydro-1H-inden-4-yl]propanoyl:CoA ligase-like [Mytilus trossulus]|uniref:3-[(3aS,4S,7aS)-7a-methyl-1, 5-dioxo-octahydro-1H-inden-4-yl]propanoyl:CoA ligase-like n=1 Tax=Mytilus trossulus TaxID=6551 RepID=UPI00300780DE